MRKVVNGNRLIFNTIGYIYIIILTVLCFIPFWLIISGSFTSEASIFSDGFRMIPKEFSLDAYKFLFKYPGKIIDSYMVTILLTLIGGSVGIFVMSMTAYVLMRKDFKYRNFFSFFFYFTTLFHGGLIPFYLLFTKYLGLKNNFLALLLPSLMSAWLIILMKNFMKSIPDVIMESAKIDGAGDFLIFLKIILPLAKPGLATVGLFLALTYWNDWFHALLFIEEPKLYPLQFMLYKVMQSVEGLKMASSASFQVQLPTESLKMSTAVVATGPIIILYPYLQKYFVKGLTIGAVKG